MPQCAVLFCKGKKRPFHPFPINDKQLFDIWKGCVYNYHFTVISDKEIFKQYYVCDEHFVDSCKIPGTNKLKKCSIPTLNVSGFKTNSNLNIAYNLYIEKQEKDPIYRSVKNVTLDHNYVDKIFIEDNTRIGNEDLDNCTFINLNSESPNSRANISEIWIDQDVDEEVTNLDSHDPLTSKDSNDIDQLLNDKNDLEQEIISMQNITDPLISEEKSELKNYSGPNKQIRKKLKPKKCNVIKSHITCSVPGCKNKYGSFHKFPANESLCKKWTETLGITKTIKYHMKICSHHFKTTDYFTKFVSHGNSRRVLKRTAIPFINNSKTLTWQQKKIICAAHNCYKNNIDHKNVNFFRFPCDEKLARIWANKAERDDLSLRPKFMQMKLYLCENHFESAYFKNGKKREHRPDIKIIPTIFNSTDNLSEPGELYCNLFVQTYEQERHSLTKVSNEEMKRNARKNNTLQTYLNDVDLSKITFDEKIDKSEISDDYGKMNYSHSLYEDFVSNPGVLNLKPQPTDLLFRKEYCRLCAKLCSVVGLISILDKSGKFTKHGEMLDVCFPGKVQADDKLPHWICPKCEHKLNICYTSIKEFIEAENRLKKIFNKNFNEEIIELPEIIKPPENTKHENEIPEAPKLIDNPPNMPPEINKIIEENNKYQCLKCDQVFNTKKELVDHSLKAHNSSNSIVCKIVASDAKPKKPSTNAVKVKCSSLRYECVICNSLHEKKDSLIKHTLAYHSQSGKSAKIVCRVVRQNNLRNKHLTCLHCKEEFGNFSTYRKHMKKQHLKLNCEKCGKHFTRMYRLLAHVKLHDVKSVSCSRCPLIFQDQFELLKHQKTHKSDVSEDEESLISPQKKKIAERSLCNICGKLFSSSTLLKYHLEKHGDLRWHKCSTCSKAFNSIISLRQHKKVHSTSERCICQVCGKQFGYLSCLKSHMLTHSTHRPYVCEICGAGFHRRNNLKKHLLTHEKIKDNPYECKTCRLEFKSRVLYLRHKKQHTNSNSDPSDKKSFDCDICAKKFLTKFQVKIHRRIHTGETPYPCRECGKSFRSVALVKQHTLIHMNVFPHQCNYCDRQFRRLQSLVVHRRTHTGEKPYPCPVCGRPFANRSDMNKHKHNLHFLKNKQQSTLINQNNIGLINQLLENQDDIIKLDTLQKDSNSIL